MDTILTQLRPASILRSDIYKGHLSPHTTSRSLLRGHLTEIVYSLNMPCIEAVITYQAGNVSNEITFLSDVMKIDSAVFLNYVLITCD